MNYYIKVSLWGLALLSVITYNLITITNPGYLESISYFEVKK